MKSRAKLFSFSFLHPPVSARNIKEVLRRLKEVYGEPTVRTLPPLEELIVTILSQNTTDKNRDVAYRRLRERYSRWEEVLRAPLEELEEVIRPAGLPRGKARAIKAALSKAKGTFGELTLDPLKEWDDGEAFRFLTEIPGVGTKTAAVVMIFSLGRPFFPVDTHIRRVAERLGWVGEGTPRERTQEILDALIPDEDKFEGHLLLIEHGRRYCRARRPLCSECPVVDLCPFPKKRRRGPT